MALTLIAALALVFLRSTLFLPDAAERMVVSGNDNIMRLLSVRDWMAGQSWFDMSNQRVLPPDGISLHWSRYVDLGIAGVIGGLSVFMPYEAAEVAALVVWPALLMVAFLAVTTAMTYQLFGPRAAMVAVLSVVLWRLTGYNYFGPLQIDHHGMQILLLGIVVFTLVSRGPEIWRGMIGGTAAALSLAVGLENLLPIAAAGVILAVGTIWSGTKGHVQLRAFGSCLFIVALALHFGQTQPSAWFHPQCDELATPVLGILGVAAMASLLIGTSAPRTPALRRRIAILTRTTIVAGLATVLSMQACPNFPYGNLPDEIRELISIWIIEARPAQTFIRAGEPLAFSHILPTFATTIVATLLLVMRRRSGRANGRELRVTTVLLVFAWIGTLGSFAQVRMNVLSAPVIPVLMGYCVAALFSARRDMARRNLGSLAVVAFVAAALLPGQLHLAYTIGTTAHAAGIGSNTIDGRRTACRSPDIIRSLNDLPPGRVLSPNSLAPPILYATDHTLVSAPYHRSADALGNGLLPFVGDAEVFFGTVERAQPDYVVMCSGGHYGVDGTAFVNAFARGETVEGFNQLSGFAPEIIVLEVTR